MTTCKHFSPLEGFNFHKNPHLPTFSHDAHYKSGESKVKGSGAKIRTISREKSGNIGKQEGKWQKSDNTKTNLNNKIKAIECKPNVIH
jgi:hypothetical protein